MLAFTFIHQEALIMNLSHIMKKLETNIYHPLLVKLTFCFNDIIGQHFMVNGRCECSWRQRRTRHSL